MSQEGAQDTDWLYICTGSCVDWFSRHGGLLLTCSHRELRWGLCQVQVGHDGCCSGVRSLMVCE